MRPRPLFACLLCALFMAAGCDPKKPSEPKPPTPKVDFTHERSTS
jgi:hypothetical protein